MSKINTNTLLKKNKKTRLKDEYQSELPASSHN